VPLVIVNGACLRLVAFACFPIFISCPDNRILILAVQVKDEYENRFNEWKSQYMAEKNDLKFKCEDLESKLKRANSMLADVQKFHDKVFEILLVSSLPS